MTTQEKKDFKSFIKHYKEFAEVYIEENDDEMVEWCLLRARAAEALAHWMGVDLNE